MMSPATSSHIEADNFNLPKSQRLQAFIFLLTGSLTFLHITLFQVFPVILSMHICIHDLDL